MLSLGGVLISAVAYAALFPPFGAVALSWVALVPLFCVLRQGGWKRGAWAGGLFAGVMTAIIIAWLVPTLSEYFERPLPLVLGVFALVVLGTTPVYYAAAGALVAHLRGRLPRVAWLVCLPAAWVGAEFARTTLGFASAWALLGEAHFESARLRQVADLTAVYGVSGIVALGNAVLVEAWGTWRERARPGPLAVGAGLFVALLAGALGYGESRRVPPGDSNGAHGDFEVALVQGNVEPRLRWQRVHATRVLMSYGTLSRDLSAADEAGPALFVWPENALQVGPDDPTYGPPLARMVDRLGVPLLFGAPRVERSNGSRRHHNSAFLVRPGGGVEHYDKRRLLPFSETSPLGDRGDLDASSYSPGRTPGFFDVAGRRLGVLICFEVIYPALARELVAGGADVLVNLSNDGWYRGSGGDLQHFQQVVFRAIETGVPLVRSTTTGISAVIAPDGRVVRRLGSGERGVLRAVVPPARPRKTLYLRVGDLFAQSCVAFCAGALLWGIRPRPGGVRPPS